MKLIKAAILLLPLLLLAAPLTHGQHSQGSTISKIPSSTSLSISLEHQAQKAYDSGFYKQAISLLVKALKLDPNNPRILTNLGAAENELGNYTGSLSYLKALLLDPKYVVAMFIIGSTLSHLGYDSQDLSYLREALSLPPPLHQSPAQQLVRLALGISSV